MFSRFLRNPHNNLIWYPGAVQLVARYLGVVDVSNAKETKQGARQAIGLRRRSLATMRLDRSVGVNRDLK